MQLTETKLEDFLQSQENFKYLLFEDSPKYVVTYPNGRKYCDLIFIIKRNASFFRCFKQIYDPEQLLTFMRLPQPRLPYLFPSWSLLTNDRLTFPLRAWDSSVVIRQIRPPLHFNNVLEIYINVKGGIARGIEAGLKICHCHIMEIKNFSA